MPSFGTLVSSTNTPPSTSGRYSKNTKSKVTAQNLTRRGVPQRPGVTLT